MSDHEVESLRLAKMKKQIFLEKISKELREKEKINYNKKKLSA